MKGATAAMAVKTDRNDARAIAHAMRVGWFTVVHVKTAESHERRLLLNNRRTLLEKRMAIDNEIRGTLKAFGLKLGAVTVAAFEVRVLELLAKRSRLAAMVRPMLAARVALREQCAASDGAQGRASKRGVPAPPLRAWCRPIVALTFGLTPRKYASGEIDRNGSLTMAGDGVCARRSCRLR
jgi:transposase